MPRQRIRRGGRLRVFPKQGNASDDHNSARARRRHLVRCRVSQGGGGDRRWSRHRLRSIRGPWSWRSGLVGAVFGGLALTRSRRTQPMADRREPKRAIEALVTSDRVFHKRSPVHEHIPAAQPIPQREHGPLLPVMPERGALSALAGLDQIVGVQTPSCARGSSHRAVHGVMPLSYADGGGRAAAIEAAGAASDSSGPDGAGPAGRRPRRRHAGRGARAAGLQQV